MKIERCSNCGYEVEAVRDVMWGCTDIVHKDNGKGANYMCRREKVPKIIVENKTTPFEIAVKRFYFPAVIELDCPTCGKRIHQDLEDQYLSYPFANKPFAHDMYHYDEETKKDCEFQVQLKLTIKLEVVE